MHSADPAGGRRSNRAVDLTLFGLATALSAYVLLWPNPPGEPPFANADKIAHASVFLAVAWTGRRAGFPLPALAAGLVSYAVGSEVVQHTLLPDRQGDWTDVVADLVGAVVGLLLPRSRRPSERAR